MIDFSVLDDLEEIKKIDPKDMLGVVRDFPEMLERAAAFAKTVNIQREDGIKGVVFSGMGGSAISGDIARSFVEASSEVPIIVNRGYTLPKYINKEYVFIAISYSGNTEETLSSLRDAEVKGLKIIAISSGGKLTQIAEEKGYPLISLPKGFQPRAALPVILASALVLLEKLGVQREISTEINEAVKLLKRARDEHIKERRISAVKQLAQRLHGKIPLIWASLGVTEAAGLRWVTQLNENSKLMAHLNIFSELNHNEMVAVGALSRTEHNFALVILRDDGDNERVKKRIEVTKSLVAAQLGGSIDVASQGTGRLARVLSLILYGDFLSVYLALIKRIDPTEVDIIERLKKELQR